MSLIETQVLRETWDVDARLAEFDLNRVTLLEVRDIAISSASNATQFHPANAAGTFSYQDGTWALRDRHVRVGGEWEMDRTHAVESILNLQRKLRIVFSNVDIACDDDQLPQPRSKKGAGSDRAFSGNLFGFNLPHYAPRQSDGFAAYYLMVDERGAAELTRPVVRNGRFAAYVERVYLSDGSELDMDKLSLDDNDRVDDVDPIVQRK